MPYRLAIPLWHFAIITQKEVNVKNKKCRFVKKCVEEMKNAIHKRKTRYFSSKNTSKSEFLHSKNTFLKKNKKIAKKHLTNEKLSAIIVNVR